MIPLSYRENLARLLHTTLPPAGACAELDGRSASRASSGARRGGAVLWSFGIRSLHACLAFRRYAWMEAATETGLASESYIKDRRACNRSPHYTPCASASAGRSDRGGEARLGPKDRSSCHDPPSTGFLSTRPNPLPRPRRAACGCARCVGIGRGRFRARSRAGIDRERRKPGSQKRSREHAARVR